MATNNNTQKKFDKFKYAYGQIYRGFLESGKAEKFVITNVHVREWLGVLSYFKKKEYIVNFKLGDTIETACDLGIEGFNLDKVDQEQYLKYGNGVLNNYLKEVAEAKSAA